MKRTLTENEKKLGMKILKEALKNKTIREGFGMFDQDFLDMVYDYDGRLPERDEVTYGYHGSEKGEKFINGIRVDDEPTVPSAQSQVGQDDADDVTEIGTDKEPEGQIVVTGLELEGVVRKCVAKLLREELEKNNIAGFEDLDTIVDYESDFKDDYINDDAVEPGHDFIGKTIHFFTNNGEELNSFKIGSVDKDGVSYTFSDNEDNYSVRVRMSDDSEINNKPMAMLYDGQERRGRGYVTVDGTTEEEL